jgi:hypothetical protein
MSLDISTQSINTGKVALLGFSITMMESLRKANYDFVAVVLPDAEYYMKEHNIPYVTWDFGQVNEKSVDLYDQLKAMHVDVAVPLYEETVEWAGALNSRFRDDPRLFNRYYLFRDKAMMKRKAQMSGIRVGVFEEAENIEDTQQFFKRVNKALLKLEGEEEAMVHLKPTSAAGCIGHKLLRCEKDITALEPDDFPCLLETHLDGQEFSCEVFIHNGKIRFLNITEYIRLGHTNFIPASPELESKRPLIEKAVQDLIDAFGIEYGMIHPEFFITPNDVISFGEVAARIPGGHIFDLISKAYGFDTYVGFAMCSNPKTTEEELDAFFPDPTTSRKQYSGCVMVYPKHKTVTGTHIPDELLYNPYYEKHDLFVPVNAKVAERAGFGNHYGTVYFNGEDPEVMRELLIQYDNFDFYNTTDSKLEEAHV